MADKYFLTREDVLMLKRMAQAYRNSGHNLSPHRRRGISVPMSGGTSWIPVKCTSADDPEAGLHTFKKCDLDGVILTGDDEVIYTSCRIFGDWDSDFPIVDSGSDQTYGLLLSISGTNVVWLANSIGYGYYYDSETPTTGA